MRLVLAAAVVVLAVGLTGAEARAQNLGFECDPPICEIPVGDSIDVYITIDAPITDLRGFSTVLDFDPVILTPISVTKGALLNGACPSSLIWVNQAAVGDSIYADGAGLGCSFNGPGTIVCIRFVGTMSGVSPLNWRGTILRDSLNQDIPHNCLPGSVNVVSPVPVETVTWGSIKERGAQSQGLPKQE
jgi:hypothetical protein